MKSILNIPDYTYILSARGPLANLPALDKMWVSFYSIGAMLIAYIILNAIRKWVKNSFLALILRFIAFIIFLIGSLLMILVIFTWPS